jgi:carboxymethylenebutenolidase
MPGMSDPRTVQVACDGGEMTMHVWTPESGSGPAIVLLQEIFGVGPYIKDVGARLAEAGYIVGAPDVFWRFAPGWESTHDQNGLTASVEQAGKLDPPTAIGDCVAALNTLQSMDEASGAPAVMGFCLGGTLAWGVAMAGDPSACVSYYGSGVPSMLDGIDAASCPTLFHFGNDDAFIPNEGVEAINAAIDGRAGFVLNIENAGHAFDNHRNPMFWNESAAQVAWAKTMAFLAEHLPVG